MNVTNLSSLLETIGRVNANPDSLTQIHGERGPMDESELHLWLGLGLNREPALLCLKTRENPLTEPNLLTGHQFLTLITLRKPSVKHPHLWQDWLTRRQKETRQNLEPVFLRLFPHMETPQILEAFEALMTHMNTAAVIEQKAYKDKMCRNMPWF